MLRSLFLWLDGNAWSYWAVAMAATVAYLAWLNRSLQRAPAGRSALWLDAFALGALLLAWRWPWLLLATELNPDESQLIAGALTLAHDPVFWRSVDGTTSGPLNFYALLPLAWLGLPLDYFTGRLAGLFMVWLGLISLKRGLEAVLSRAAAAIATLPALAFFATTTEGDFLHLSSEHLTLALLPFAVALVLRTSVAPSGSLRAMLGAAAIAGLIPWAKLQAAPLGAMVVLWAAASAWARPEFRQPRDRWRASLLVLIAGALPSVLVFALAAGTGQWGAMWLGYLLQNFTYIEQAGTLGETLHGLWQRAGESGQFVLFLALESALCAGGLVLSRRWGRAERSLVGWITALAVMAVAVVLVPRRDFLHYLLLAVFPFAFLGGIPWRGLAPAERAPSRGWWLGGAILVFATFLALRGPEGTPPIFGQFLDHWRRPHFADGAALRGLARPGDTLAIWGWSPRTHVESALPQAGRDPHTVWMIENNPRRDDYRARFLADFGAARPAFFLDATGPAAFVFIDRSRHGHENFPALADAIERDYTLLGDWSFARLYGRNDHLATHHISAGEVARLSERGRRPSIADVTAPDRMSEGVSLRRIDGREAFVLLPPASLEWRLEPNVRGVRIEFGVDPAAVAARGTDGVELLIELVEGDNVRLLHRRWLRPVQLPADAGPQTAEIPLPPFGSSAWLRVRSAAGPDGDTAWDWLYVCRVALPRSKSYQAAQFPGFSRPPDRAIAEHAAMIDHAGDRLLMLHSPAQLDFRLRGNERSLQFDYGLLDGAYTNGGQSDGVSYIIEIIPAAGEPKVIFRRRLEPGTVASDRGEQQGKIALPPLQRGDVLRLNIDPGPAGSRSWDWAYVRRWQLF